MRPQYTPGYPPHPPQGQYGHNLITNPLNVGGHPISVAHGYPPAHYQHAQNWYCGNVVLIGQVYSLVSPPVNDPSLGLSPINFVTAHTHPGCLYQGAVVRYQVNRGDTLLAVNVALANEDPFNGVRQVANTTFGVKPPPPPPPHRQPKCFEKIG